MLLERLVTFFIVSLSGAVDIYCQPLILPSVAWKCQLLPPNFDNFLPEIHSKDLRILKAQSRFEP